MVSLAAVIVPVLCITIGVSVSVTWKWRIIKINFKQNGGKPLNQYGVRIFIEAELAKATNNYNDNNKHGEGGFGSVYQGRIEVDTMVAVKKPKDVHKSLVKGDFQHKIKIVTQINHRKVVKLKGICLETRIPLLVYEYDSNGTLF
ncbi:hypothetical protein ACJRO7_023786 [Eucalyptus globulus]|uniref:Protein kinase domain-containing protein n=1 Tax=Eucalyptus globulus TaxID=34317 RepID=A0ABD3K7Z6_EUCGL